MLLDPKQYSEVDDVPQENAGRGGNTFPHLAPADPAQAASVLAAFPWMDDFTLQFALAAMNIRGFDGGAVRPPLRNLDAEAKARVADWPGSWVGL